MLVTNVNMRLKSQHYAKMGTLKRVMYATQINHEWTRPEIVPLESFRRAPTDRPITLLKRMVG